MLIRDFRDIRDVIRLFLIYGFFSKREIALRNGIKEITYDKYKKTIHNLIDNEKIKYYVNEKREKCVYISVDYVMETDNPLFTIWQGKSITANDVWFLFAITDVMSRSSGGLTVADVAEKLSQHANRGIEEQTVRNRLDELSKLGLVRVERVGKRKLYALDDRFLEDLPEEQLLELDTFGAFFQNVYPLGVLGNHLRRKVSLLTLEASPTTFMFKHHHLGNTLDDEVLLAIFRAINERRRILFDLQIMQDEVIRFKRIPFVPMKLIADLWQGRRYIAGYDEELGRYWCFRLDKMFHVELAEPCEPFPTMLGELGKQLEKSWCVVMPLEGSGLEVLEMRLHVNPDTEGYVLDRLHAEGKWGVVRQTNLNQFDYRIDVNNAEEMIPWIRTFTGRIVEIRCSNPAVAAKLSADWANTLEQYKCEEEL